MYDCPPVKIIELAKSYGLNVFQVDYEKYPDVFGVLDYRNNDILINKDIDIAYKRFTIAFEIAIHVLYRNEFQKNVNISICDKYTLSSKNKINIKCTKFALKLLMPKDMFKEIKSLFYWKSTIAEIFCVNLAMVEKRNSYWF